MILNRLLFAIARKKSSSGDSKQQNLDPGKI